MRYQASIFTDTSNITPTPNNFKKAIDMFSEKGLIPYPFHELKPQGPERFTQQRIGLRSPTGEWLVNFPSGRIDIMKHLTEPQGKNMGELGKFCLEVTSFFEKIVKEFEKKAHRLALITEFLLGEMTDSNLSAIYLKLFKPPKFYAEALPFEWDWRSASKKQFDLEGEPENLNVITIINRTVGEMAIKGEVTRFDRIHLSFDINTTPENKSYRFDIRHITNFYDEIFKLHNDLLKEIGEFIYG
jgi:hypothetical protein